VFKRVILLFGLLTIFSSTTYTMSKSDPVIVSVGVDRLEIRDPGGDNAIYFEGSASIGQDAYHFVVNAEIEREHGITDESEIQVLYGVPISTYWDIYAGIRKDIKPDPNRTWGMLSIAGLAPGFIEIEASLFIGESGRTGLRIEAEHEFALTNYWTFVPGVVINVSGQNDEAMDVGSGLSEIEASLLFSYGRHPQWSPYIGLQWGEVFGETADYVEEEGEDVSDSVFVMGVSVTF
jgi:copper resistance protein B